VSTPAPAPIEQPLGPRRCLFVSDVHLEATGGAAERQFLHFLRTEAVRAETLYILGDLFESWVGDDDPGHREVIGALAQLSGRGVACFLMHGNRDFLLGEGFCARTGCRLLPDPVVTQFAGEPVLLTHGDALCTDDRAYQELRTTVRAPLWQRRFLSLPFATRELLANEARTGSKSHTARAPPRVMDVNPGAVEAAFRATQVRRMIHGHTHRPAIHDALAAGQAVQRIVLGAWYEQGSFLRCQDGRYELCELPR
jgi:UDP-2,3-diacylglucosamine hydrolase